MHLLELYRGGVIILMRMLLILMLIIIIIIIKATEHHKGFANWSDLKKLFANLFADHKVNFHCFNDDETASTLASKYRHIMHKPIAVLS